jgi:hypothetical protein
VGNGIVALIIKAKVKSSGFKFRRGKSGPFPGKALTKDNYFSWIL